jgi:hypothetical protein
VRSLRVWRLVLPSCTVLSDPKRDYTIHMHVPWFGGWRPWTGVLVTQHWCEPFPMRLFERVATAPDAFTARQIIRNAGT